MNEQTTALGTEMITGSVLLVVAIFFLAYRFVTRARRVNKKVREQHQEARADDAA